MLAVQAIAERFALDERHHIIEEARGVSGVVQRQDVRVLQPGGDLDLLDEPVRPDLRRQLGMQHLDRDAAVMLQVFGEEYGGHPPTPQLPLHGIAVGERLTQGLNQLHSEQV